MSSLKRLASELGADARSAKALPALLFGSVYGVITLIYQLSLGLIIFSGPLAPYSSEGIRMALFGGFAVCLMVALAGSYKGAIGCTAAASAMVLGAIGSSIAQRGGDVFATMVATLIIGVVATSVCVLMLGRFRLSNLLRFIPYSVAAGYLAGAGGVLCLTALSLMGVNLDRQPLSSLFEPALIGSWGLGVAFGLGVFLALKRGGSFLILPVSFLLAATLFHVGLSILGISDGEARAAGLLFSGMADEGPSPASRLGALAHVDWDAVAMQFPNILTLILVTLLSVAANVSALELAADCDLDWDREFRAAGWGGLVAGAGGGPPGVVDPIGSPISHTMGADTRLTGIVVALVLGSALLLGDTVLKLVPVPLMGGLLLYIGVAMLHEWLLGTRSRLPWIDYGILLLILATIVSLGFLEGLVVGVGVTTMVFAFRLARVDSVEAEFTARERRSNRIRPIADRAILLAEGERVRAYRLRGYLFFGSAHALAARLKQSLSEELPPSCILLDFGAVSGLDFSAVNALCRFVWASHEVGVRVAMSAASANCRTGLERNLPAGVYDDLVFEPNVDRALERCEDIVIAARRSDLRRAEGPGDLVLDRFVGDMERHLDRRIRFEDLAHELREWLDVRDYAPGDILVTLGAPQNGLQLLLMGRASVYDAAGVQLRQCGPGDAMEVRGAFEAYAAPVAAVAEEPCRTLVLTPAVRRRLEERQGALMLELYGYLLTGEASAADLPGLDSG